ncbi:hypothetical protein ACJD0Z_16780 [Flavobacteriaceae bacterium M23B6Z8]
MKIFKIVTRILLAGLILGIIYISVSYHMPGDLKADSFMEAEMKHLEELRFNEKNIEEDVSSAPVAWHLDHILLTINGIYKTLKESDTTNYHSSLNIPRVVMFSLNFIPRGRAKSPERVRPKDDVDLITIEKHLEEALQNLNRFDSLPENANFIHPYIGQLNREGAKRFLKIHTRHHLKICDDIILSKKE